MGVVWLVISFVCLGVFMGIAKLVNMSKRQPVLNGARGFNWLYAVLAIGLVAYIIFFGKHTTELGVRYAGYLWAQTVLAWVPACITAIVYSRRFKRRLSEEVQPEVRKEPGMTSPLG